MVSAGLVDTQVSTSHAQMPLDHRHDKRTCVRTWYVPTLEDSHQKHRI